MILVALAAWTLPGHYADRVLRDELQTMVRAVWSQAEPGDVVLLDSGSRYPIFDYYYAGRGASAARPEVLLLPPDDREVTPEAVDALLGEWLGAGQRVWLAEVDVTLSDPERLARAWLGERYALAASWAYGHNALLLFDGAGRPPALAANYAPQHADVAGQRLGGGTLRGWELPVERFAPGDGVHVALPVGRGAHRSARSDAARRCRPHRPGRRGGRARPEPGRGPAPAAGPDRDAGHPFRRPLYLAARRRR